MGSGVLQRVDTWFSINDTSSHQNDTASDLGSADLQRVDTWNSIANIHSTNNGNSSDLGATDLQRVDTWSDDISTHSRHHDDNASDSGSVVQYYIDTWIDNASTHCHYQNDNTSDFGSTDLQRNDTPIDSVVWHECTESHNNDSSDECSPIVGHSSARGVNVTNTSYQYDSVSEGFYECVDNVVPAPHISGTLLASTHTVGTDTLVTTHKIPATIDRTCHHCNHHLLSSHHQNHTATRGKRRRRQVGKKPRRWWISMVICFTPRFGPSHDVADGFCDHMVSGHIHRNDNIVDG